MRAFPICCPAGYPAALGYEREPTLNLERIGTEAIALPAPDPRGDPCSAAGLGGGGQRCGSKKAGREWKGLSPFNAEKTPSFYVNDQKQFYHCFSSGKHGDIFTFLMETEGLSFPEAVERLAAEAGVALPKITREDQVEEVKRKSLYDVMELAAEFFEASLKGRFGAKARDYLAGPLAEPRDPGALPHRLRAARPLSPCAIISPARASRRNDGGGGPPGDRRGRQGPLRPFPRPRHVPDLRRARPRRRLRRAGDERRGAREVSELAGYAALQQGPAALQLPSRPQTRP